jgi:hypothetical protein
MRSNAGPGRSGRRRSVVLALMLLVVWMAGCFGPRDATLESVRAADQSLAAADQAMAEAAGLLANFANLPPGAKIQGMPQRDLENQLQRARERLAEVDVWLARAAADAPAGWQQDYLATRRMGQQARLRGFQELEAAARDLGALWQALDYVELGGAWTSALRQDLDEIVGLLQADKADAARDRIGLARRDIATHRQRYLTAAQQTQLRLFLRLAQRLDTLDEVLGLLGRAAEALAAQDPAALRALLAQVQPAALALEQPVTTADQTELRDWFAAHVHARLERAALDWDEAAGLEAAARALVQSAS